MTTDEQMVEAVMRSVARMAACALHETSEPTAKQVANCHLWLSQACQESERTLSTVSAGINNLLTGDYSREWLSDFGKYVGNLVRLHKTMPSVAVRAKLRGIVEAK